MIKQSKTQELKDETIERIWNENELDKYIDYNSKVHEAFLEVYNESRIDALNEIKQFIENERDKGNIIDQEFELGHKGFSASLCLSKLLNEVLKDG